jgi:16S rRNA (cytosine967-C5)-methyltransferase
MKSPRPSGAPKTAPKPAPKNRPENISPARQAAFNILLAVEIGHSHSHSDTLLRSKQVNALSPPDRNLATALVLGVLRWQILLDHQLQSLLTHPNARLDTEIQIALRIGAFQILHMDRIPARAAIDESVELAKRAGHRYASGMVNAVLRKLSAASQSGQNTQSIPALSPEKGTGFSPYIMPTKEGMALAPEGMRPKNSPAALALAQAHPVWMVERWANLYGLAAASAICHHGQTQPVQTIRLVSQDAESQLTQAGIVFEPGQLLTPSRNVVSGDLSTAEAFRDARIRFQDEGSQLVAEIAAANLHKRNGQILDACAAPGGKTLILAERNSQAHILACESSPARFEHLQLRLAAHASQIECRLADVTALGDDSTFDLVLADVPCSGTGTLGRNPEIRHRLRPEDLPRQAERQGAILTAALRALRPGGRVVYSTCSLEPEENEQVVAAVLAQSTTARQLSLEASIEALLRDGILHSSAAARLKASFTPQGVIRLLPGEFHTDGFFIALIEREN